MYQLGKVDSYKQLFSNGTSCRQTAIQNVVLSLLSELGYEMVTLSSGIVAKDKTSQSLLNSVGKSFAEGQSLLEGWRETTSKSFGVDLTIHQADTGKAWERRLCIDRQLQCCPKICMLLMELIKQTCIEQRALERRDKDVSGQLLATPKERVGWCCCASIEQVS